MALNGTEKELEQKKSEEKELNQAFTGNCSISSSSNVKTKDLHLLLTYTGAYAYAAIISLALRELFDNKWDKVFNLECISAFLKRLNLPKKVSFIHYLRLYFPSYTVLFYILLYS